MMIDRNSPWPPAIRDISTSRATKPAEPVSCGHRRGLAPPGVMTDALAAGPDLDTSCLRTTLIPPTPHIREDPSVRTGEGSAQAGTRRGSQPGRVADRRNTR